MPKFAIPPVGPETIVVAAGITTIYVYQLGLEPGTVSCTPFGATASNLSSSASNLNANGQTQAFFNSMATNTQSRFGGGAGNTVTKNRMFVSTQNMARSQMETTEWNAWVSAEGRNYNGGIDGYSADVVVGADKLFSDNFLAGVLLGFSHTDIKDATKSAKVGSPAIGTYFASRFAGDLILDSYVSYARPEYKLDGTSFKSDRTSVGLSLTGEYAASTGTIRPFGRLSGYSEDQPAYTGTGGAVASNKVDSYKASLGARFESGTPLGSTGLMPYLSGAVDYVSSKSTVTGKDDFVAPRVGFGVSGPVGGGNLSFDIDGGKVTSDTYDVGLRATYEFNF